ncbi:hypothetical protein C0991_010214 [Blastosporella zonata]|nr:hypothetical protein C0991_010214 [Blastosporella zonata]
MSIIFTEASYAAFLYGGGLCEVCKKPTDALYCSFGIKLRLCRSHSCKSKWIDKGDRKHFDHRILPHDEEIKQCIPWVENNECLLPNKFGSKHVKLYRDSDSVREALDCIATNDYLENNKAKIALIIKYMEFCTKLDEWKALRQHSYTSNEAINDGFARMIATTYGLKNQRIERVTQSDYNSVASKVERLLIKLADARERKGREAVYLKNRTDVAEHYQRLRSKQPPVALPSLEVFRRLPIIEMVQGTSPATVEYPPKEGSLSVAATLRNQKWVADRLETELQQWKDKAKKDLGAVLGFPNWKTASSMIVHPVGRISARFLCKICSKVSARYREDDCLDFAGACAHACRTKKKDKRVDGIWTASNFVKDTKAIAALNKVFTLFDVDESLSNAFLILACQGARVMCTTCQPGIVMDYQYGIGHSHRHERMDMKLISHAEAINLLQQSPFVPSIVRLISGSAPRKKAVRADVNFGCRHCLNLELASVVPVETGEQNSAVKAETTAIPDNANVNQAAEGKHRKAKPVEKRFSFPGITSHLKEK